VTECLVLHPRLLALLSPLRILLQGLQAVRRMDAFRRHQPCSTPVLSMLLRTDGR